MPPNVAAAVAKALEKLPADRFESAAEFAQALADEKWAGEPTRLTRSVASGPSSRLRHPALGWICVALLAMGVAVLSVSRPPARTAAPVFRFGIDLPSPANLRATSPAPRLSPDGRRLVIPAVMNGKRQLYLVSLDEGIPRLLPAGDEPAGPAFSPDGRWLAFQSARQAVQGGARRRNPHSADRRLRAGRRVGRGRQHHLQRGLQCRPVADPGRRRDAGFAHGARHRERRGGPFLAPDPARRTSGPLHRRRELDAADQARGRSPREPGRESAGGGRRRWPAAARWLGCCSIAPGPCWPSPSTLRRLEVTGAPVPVLQHVGFSRLVMQAAYDVSRTGTLAWAADSELDAPSAYRLALPRWTRESRPRRGRPLLRRPAVPRRAAHRLWQGRAIERRLGRRPGDRSADPAQPRTPASTTTSCGRPMAAG